MKTIRSKLILIFIAIVLLPLLPIIWLVNGLVQQSYRIGVNPQVEAALGSGVEYSRELYRIRKEHLLETLSQALSAQTVRQLLEHAPIPAENFRLPESDGNWQFQSLQVYDAAGNLLRQVGVPGAPSTALNGGHFAQAAEAPEGKILFTNRQENLFIALEKRSAGGKTGYLALVAALPEGFLRDTDRSLEVYQLYRTLALSPASIPRGFLYVFVLLTVMILLATMGIAAWLSRRLTRSIGELVKGTQEVGRGNLDYRVQAQGHDEIGELARHFNRMAGELKNFQERAIYLEKMAAWQEIARRLAHEIKNPLTPIQLTMQQMVDQYRGEDRNYRQLLQECQGIISEEIENLRRLVQEFSDFGRLPELHLSESDLHTLIREVQRLYPHREIRLELAGSVPPLLLDEDRIRRVLINLVENAIQADPANHPIVIRSRLAENRVEVSVSDQGEGILPEAQEKIFQPYFSTKSSGIGLGLAITRKMVEEHEGKIWVESKPGEGSTFTFTLPIKGRVI